MAGCLASRQTFGAVVSHRRFVGGSPIFSLFQAVPLSIWSALLGHVLSFLLSVFAFVWVAATSNSAIWLFLAGLVLSVCAATRLRAAGNMMHEAVHNHLARDRHANALLGRLLSIVLWTSFSSYKSSHQSHHRFVGHPTKDRDLARIPRAWLNSWSPWKVALYILQFRYLWIFVVNKEFWPFARGDKIWEVCAKLTFVGCFLCFAMLGWHYEPVLLTASVFCIFVFLFPYQALKFVSDLWDHAGLLEEQDLRLRARNHPIHLFQPTSVFWSSLNTLLNMLFLPRNDGHHLEHHLFPSKQTHSLGLGQNQGNHQYRG
jgi:fatty acid desaturase